MNKSCKTAAVVILVALSVTAGRCEHEAAAQQLGAASTLPPANAIPLREFLVLPAVGHYGRLPLHRDEIEAQLVAGSWQPPSGGDEVQTTDGDRQVWHTAIVGDDGFLDTRKLRGGYAFATFDSSDERVMLLAAQGHAAVYVNGVPRTGDPYGLGWLRLPVLVRRGENELLFHLGSDRFSAKLTPPPSDIFFSDDDRTLPTLVRGEEGVVWAAVPVVNASRDWLYDVQIECSGADETVTTRVAPIPPLSVRKVGFLVPAAVSSATRRAQAGGGEESVEYHIRLVNTGDVAPPPDAAIAESDVRLQVAGPDDVQIRTFRSRVDGSVQPYAVRPATDEALGSLGASGLIVALHAAGVDCEQFAEQYAPKPWAHVVAPQGRRPYGFDWEDWGRLDVLEVLADASRHLPHDPRRTYLTGQSMGGHGVWHLGVTDPGRFAAIGSIGGWASFWSYGGGMPDYKNPTPLQALLLRGSSPSDTLSLLTNLATTGVYILHGADDEQVPVAQARHLRSLLAEFHPNFVYFEQPGGSGRWAEESCDWPRMMEFFQHLILPSAAERKEIDFATADPGVSSGLGWVSIEAQQAPLELSRVVIQQDPDVRSFVGRTDNVLRLAIDVAHWPPDAPIQVTLDDQALPRLVRPVEGTKLWFERRDDRWAATSQPPPHVKQPPRCGPFKAAFDNHVLLVYGTGGTPAENEWAEAKARYDAETFWYRGGGTLDVLPDTRFDPHQDGDRNVVLYGNAETNRAWAALLSACPVQVQRNGVTIGSRLESGSDLAALLVYPRPGSDTAMVAVVAGTGPVGMRLTNRLRYFVSGVAYPDLAIFTPDVLTKGASGIRVWGYFGPDWKIDSGDIAFGETVP